MRFSNGRSSTSLKAESETGRSANNIVPQEQFLVDYLKMSFYFLVNGDFTLWTPWSTCPDACGRTALRSRERYCTNPAPANGGKNCEGPRFQLKLCKIKQCAGLRTFSFVAVKLMCTSHQTKDWVKMPTGTTIGWPGTDNTRIKGNFC